MLDHVINKLQNNDYLESILINHDLSKVLCRLSEIYSYIW